MTNRSSALQALSALGDRSRRAILERLIEAQASVGQIAAGLPVTRSAVSQHLRVLKEAGLVTDTPDGARRAYRWDPAGLGAVRDGLDQRWSTALGSFIDFADGRLERALEAEERP